MAKEDGFPFPFGIIFFGIVMYNLFFGGDDVDDKKIDIIENSKPEIEEVDKSKKSVVDKLVSKVKEEFKNTKEEIENDNDNENEDKFSNDDLYGSTEDKW